MDAQTPDQPWPFVWIYSALWWPNDRRSGTILRYTERMNHPNTADCAVGLGWKDNIGSSHRIYGGPKPIVGIRDVPILTEHPPESEQRKPLYEFWAIPADAMPPLV